MVWHYSSRHSTQYTLHNLEMYFRAAQYHCNILQYLGIYPVRVVCFVRTGTIVNNFASRSTGPWDIARRTTSGESNKNVRSLNLKHAQGCNMPVLYCNTEVNYICEERRSCVMARTAACVLYVASFELWYRCIQIWGEKSDTRAQDVSLVVSQ